MFEARRSRKAGRFFDLLDKLPGVEGVEEVDIAGTAVQDGDRQVRAVLHVDFGRFLVRVTTVFQFEFFHRETLLIGFC